MGVSSVVRYLEHTPVNASPVLCHTAADESRSIGDIKGEALG